MEESTKAKRFDDNKKEMKHKDKVKHFVLSFVLIAVIYWLTTNILISIIVVLLIGLAKELYDQQKGKNTIKESMADFGVNILGIILGLSFSYYLL